MKLLRVGEPKKEIPAIYDIAFVKTLSDRNILGINKIPSEKDFGLFKVYQLTDLLDKFEDIIPNNSREYAMKYDCIESNNICTHAPRDKAEKIKEEQAKRRDEHKDVIERLFKRMKK